MGWTIVIRKIGKTFLGTFITFFIVVSVFIIINNMNPNPTVAREDGEVIICLFIGIIFTIFWCTFTIIDEIKNNDK